MIVWIDRRHLLGALEKVGLVTVFGATLLFFPVIDNRSPVLLWMFSCNIIVFATLPFIFIIYGAHAKKHRVSLTSDKRCSKCKAATSPRQARCMTCGGWFAWSDETTDFSGTAKRYRRRIRHGLRHH